MSRKIFLEKKIGDGCLVKYFLLEEKSCKTNINLYGVELEFFGCDHKLKSHEIIRKITDSKDIILHMLKIMAEKDVTPRSLLYVVDQIFDMANKKNQYKSH